MRLIYGYIAYNEEDIPRYVGIGQEARYKHVNSGESHNPLLNVDHDNGKVFRIEKLNFISKELAAKWEIEKIAEFKRISEGGTLYNISLGGELTTRDLKWYYNLETLEEKEHASELEGWKLGRSPKSSISGYFWCYDPISRKQKRLKKDSKPPLGWVVGLPKEKLVKGYSWYYDPETLEALFTNEAKPEGWRTGTPPNHTKRKGGLWCYNPVTLKSTTISEIEDLEEGWKLGKLTSVKGYKWCYNYITKESGMFRKLPDGWSLGRPPFPYKDGTRGK